MLKYIMTALGIAVFLSFVIASLAWAQEDKEYTLQQLFFDVDITNDSQIDKGEFDIFHFLSFVLLDADRNGLLLKGECTGECFEQKLWPDKEKMRNSAMAGTIRKYEFITSPYRFHLIDKNKDDKISLHEYVEFGRERFQYFDSNQSNFLSGDEFCSGYYASASCDF